MRAANIFVNNEHAGLLLEIESQRRYRFTYRDDYHGQPVSLLMPITNRTYEFDRFPPFFEGLLPEGVMLDALLRIAKIDRDDLFAQLITVGNDVVGNVSIKAVK